MNNLDSKLIDDLTQEFNELEKERQIKKEIKDKILELIKKIG